MTETTILKNMSYITIKTVVETKQNKTKQDKTRQNKTKQGVETVVH